MIHVRIDDAELNSKARFGCGIVGVENLPDGDKYFFEGESAAFHSADCQGCNPGGPHPYGTPISQVDGREFARIAASWGYP